MLVHEPLSSSGESTLAFPPTIPVRCVLSSPGQIVRLLSAGASADYADDFGRTSLHEAVLSGRAAACEILLSAGAPPAPTSVGGARRRHTRPPVLPVLGVLPAELQSSCLREFPLHRSDGGPHCRPLFGSSLLCLLGASHCVSDKMGRTPLTMAAVCDLPDTARVLLAAGALAHLGISPPYEDPPGCAAALRDNASVLRAMLEGAAAAASNAVEPPPDGGSCDDEEVREEQQQRRRALAIGRVLNVRNGGRHSPLTLAVCNNHVDSLGVLLEFAPQALTSRAGLLGAAARGWCSPLCKAIRDGYHECCHMLLSAGFDLTGAGCLDSQMLEAATDGEASTGRPRPPRPTSAAPFRGTADEFLSMWMNHAPLAHAKNPRHRRELLSMAEEAAVALEQAARSDVAASRPSASARAPQPAGAAGPVEIGRAPPQVLPRRGLLPAALRALEKDMSVGQCCGGREQGALAAFHSAVGALRSFLSARTEASSAAVEASATAAAQQQQGKRQKLEEAVALLNAETALGTEKTSQQESADGLSRFRELLAVVKAAREEVVDLWMETALAIAARQAAIGALCRTINAALLSALRRKPAHPTSQGTEVHHLSGPPLSLRVSAYT